MVLGTLIFLLRTPQESLRQLPRIFANRSFLQCLWDRTPQLSNSFHSLQVHRHLWCINAITTPGPLTCPGIVYCNRLFFTALFFFFFPFLFISRGLSSLLHGCLQEQPGEVPASGHALGDLHCSKSWNVGKQKPLYTVLSHLLGTEVRQSASPSSFYHLDFTLTETTFPYTIRVRIPSTEATLTRRLIKFYY